MNPRELLHLNNENYGLLFDARRSVRYHERRCAFYEQCHHVTSLLTILMAGSVLFDLARPGSSAWWLQAIAVLAAVFAALDIILGYSRRADLHRGLRGRFADLEIRMVDGSADDDAAWQGYRRERLLIEKDEPAIYKVLDLLCRNDLLEAEGFNRKRDPEQFFTASGWQRLTRQIFRWENVSPTKP